MDFLQHLGAVQRDERVFEVHQENSVSEAFTVSCDHLGGVDDSVDAPAAGYSKLMRRKEVEGFFACGSGQALSGQATKDFAYGNRPDASFRLLTGIKVGTA